ncbi:MAG TPA: c-type cytochrome [Bryobacteraceae bacterium]|nr:c-type cytochrome [Bryobacteraceae bacterium]
MFAQQAPPAGGRGGRGGRGRGAGTAGGEGGGRGISSGIDASGNARFMGGFYPVQPPPPPEVAARGKALWESSCASCHASDLRGSDKGINLVRDQLVMDDQKGELIGKFLQEPHAVGSVPKTNWTPEQISDLAAYMHTFFMYLNVTLPAGSILVGNAAAGETYVQGHCLNGHGLTAQGPTASSLAGIGSRITDPKTLQDRFVAGGGGGRGGAAGITVTITMRDGKKITAPLVHKDDFEVVIVDPDGITRSIARNGDVPKVEVHDPLQGHRDLWLVYTDKDIHDVTAYLVTLK